jgi:hypothetical protein
MSIASLFAAPRPPPPPRPTEQATLAEQKSDFTAEGSPPPGKVSNSAPVRAQLALHPSPPPRQPPDGRR